MAFEIFYTRLSMFQERVDITDDEIREALLTTDHNIHKAIAVVEKKKPFYQVSSL
jgi:hypothetical protein